MVQVKFWWWSVLVLLWCMIYDRLCYTIALLLQVRQDKEPIVCLGWFGKVFVRSMSRIDSKTKVDLLHIVSGIRKSESQEKKKKPAESPSFGSSWIGRHSKNGFSPFSSDKKIKIKKNRTEERWRWRRNQEAGRDESQKMLDILRFQRLSRMVEPWLAVTACGKDGGGERTCRRLIPAGNIV